jgi:hypothetical protein
MAGSSAAESDEHEEPRRGDLSLTSLYTRPLHCTGAGA